MNIAALAAETDTYTAANGKVKIALKDANGEMRSTYDIMKDLYTGIEGQSVAWDELSSVEKAAMGEALAGKNQYNVFTSVMENFESAIGATSTALDSQGSAARENAKYMDSLEAKVVAIKSSFQELAINVINSDTVKGILDGVNSFLEFLNTDIGATVTKFTLLTGAITGFVSIAGNIGGKLAGMIDLFTGIGDAVSGFASAAGTASEVAGTVAGAAGTAAKGASTISETAETVITVSSNAVEAASEVADSAGDVAKTAGDVADAAGDVSKVASNTVSAASDVVSATASVAEGVAEAGSAAGKSASKMSKLSRFLGNISKFALPAAAALSGVAIAIGAMVKASHDANYTSKLDAQLQDLESNANDIEGLIDRINGMTISPDVKENLLDGLIDNLNGVEQKIQEINDKKVEWQFGGSELQNAQQKDNPNWDARGMSTSFDSRKYWEVQTEAMKKYYDEVSDMSGKSVEEQDEAITKWEEQYTKILDMADAVADYKKRNKELTDEMKAFDDWLKSSEAKEIFGGEINTDEMAFGASGLEGQIEQFTSVLQPQLEEIGETYDSVLEKLSEGTKMSATEAIDAISGLKEAFGDTEGWDDVSQKMRDALETGDIEAFKSALGDLVEQQLLAAHGMENVANATEEMKEVWAQGLVDAGLFEDLESALAFIQGVIDELNGTEVNTDGSVEALNNQEQAADEAAGATEGVVDSNTEVNNNPVTDQSSGALENQGKSAQVARDWTELVVGANQDVNSNPITTGASQSQLNQEAGAAQNATVQTNAQRDAQQGVTDNPANTAGTRSELNSVESTASRVASNVKSLWQGLVNFISGAASQIGNFFSYAGPPNNVGPSSGAKAQGGEVPETGDYWVGEQGPEIVTLPKGAKVTSNKDIQRSTGVKVEKGDIKGGYAQGTSTTSLSDDPYSNLYDVKSIKGGYAQGTDDAVSDVIEKVVEEIWDGLSENSLRDYLEKNIYEPIMNNPPTEKRYEFRDPGVETYVTKINNLIQKANAGAEEALRIAEEENEALERQLDLYEAQTKVLDHKLFLMEKNGADQYEQIALLRQMQKEANDEANSLRAQGYSDESEYIMDLQKEWQPATYIE